MIQTVLLSLLMLLALPSYASEYQPHWENKGAFLAITRSNPDILLFAAGGARKLSYSFDDELGIESGYIQFGSSVAISPATKGISLNLEWLPLAFLQFKNQTDYTHFNGEYSNILTFDSADDNFSDKAREDREDDAQSGVLVHNKFDAQLRGKIGDIVGLYTRSIDHYDFDVEGELVYEAGYDLLVENDGDIETVKWQFFYDFKSEPDRKKLIGVFHELNDSVSAGIKQRKQGVEMVWPFSFDSGEYTMMSQLGVHIDSVNREGEYFATFVLIKPFLF